MTAAIEIYTRPGCGYCSAAKSLLMRKKAAFTEHDVATDSTLRQQMWDRAGAGSTCPQIFIGDVHVGGCDELYALDRAGKVDAMLAAEKANTGARTSPSPPLWCRCAPGCCRKQASNRAQD